MNVIKFRAEGILNSFRVPFFRTYQKTFLAPPKTTIIGMLVNIMGKSEKLYYEILENDIIEVSVVIDAIVGKTKDLWSYKTFENKNNMHGRSVIRRDKLYNAKYTIYLNVKSQELAKEIVDALKEPRGIPSLGLDDEMVKVTFIDNVELLENDCNIINSVFVDKGYSYSVKVKDINKFIELPTANILPLKYVIDTKDNIRMERKSIDEYKQVEYLNCEVELKDVKSYTDGENRMVFY